MQKLDSYAEIFMWILSWLIIVWFCNSSGTFISASEDSTGTLDQIEQKIAKVTAIPREQGEVISSEYCIMYFFDELYH